MGVMDRRGFLKLFATASVAVPVAQHMGLLEQLTSWVLGPKKTIFIPPAVTGIDITQIASLQLEGMMKFIPTLIKNDAALWRLMDCAGPSSISDIRILLT